MKTARWVFRVAALYGIAALLPQYFLIDRIGRDTPPPLNHLEYFYGFVGIALAWQIVFLIIAADPVRYRPLMLPAILEKLAFGVPAIVLYSQHSLAPALFLAGVIDLVLCTAFTVSFVLTR